MKGFIFDISKSPELADDWKPGESKSKPGFVVDFGEKSPELSRKRFRPEGAPLVFDASVSPELANTRESIAAGDRATDLAGDVREQFDNATDEQLAAMKAEHEAGETGEEGQEDE